MYPPKRYTRLKRHPPRQASSRCCGRLSRRLLAPPPLRRGSVCWSATPRAAACAVQWPARNAAAIEAADTSRISSAGAPELRVVSAVR